MNVPAAFDPQYALLGSTAGALDEIHICAGMGLTACALMFMPSSVRALMVPAQSPHLQWRSQQSWYGEAPKFGNVRIQDSGPSLINGEEFRLADEVFASHVAIFGHDPFLYAQLRVLIILYDYFANHPTRMCRNFFFHGSDKAMGWHNYGYIYNFLLGRMSGEIRAMLEVGTGKDRSGPDLTTGVSGAPGVSFGAWKECFPMAAIFTAEPNAHIAHQETQVETYWVDQTNPKTIEQLFESIGLRHFELIIDDGLHSFQANRMLMDRAYRRVADGGLYIIEDVTSVDIPQWEAYLASARCNAAIVRIPHPTNTFDNCIVLIRGGQRMVRPTNEFHQDDVAVGRPDARSHELIKAQGRAHARYRQRSLTTDRASQVRLGRLRSRLVSTPISRRATMVSPDDPEAVLRFYLVTGQQIGHSPNMYFDEAWYLRQYPEPRRPFVTDNTPPASTSTAASATAGARHIGYTMTTSTACQAKN